MWRQQTDGESEKPMTENRMHIALRGLLLSLALSCAGCAHADGAIYLCTDAAGHKEFTDSQKNGKCSLLDLPGAIPAPVARPALKAQRPGSASSAPAASSGGDFPKVDGALQKARDGDRREILQDELNNEEQKLADLKQLFNGGQPERNGNERNYAKYLERVEQMKDSISRSEKNIDALKREMAAIR